MTFLFPQKMTSALTYTAATVVCQHETIGAVAGAALGRWVAKILTAQGGAALQACEEKKARGRNLIVIIKRTKVLQR